MLVKKFAYLAIVSVCMSNMGAEASVKDPVAVLAAEAQSGQDAEGENIVESDPDSPGGESLAMHYVMARLSIIQGLTERLSSELVAAVPDEVAEQLAEVLNEAHALEELATNVGAGDYEAQITEIEDESDLDTLIDRLEDVTVELEEREYYGSEALEDIVSEILNILSDL